MERGAELEGKNRRQLIAIHDELVRRTGAAQLGGLPFSRQSRPDMVTTILWIEEEWSNR
jgi:hypothetical protein